MATGYLKVIVVENDSLRIKDANILIEHESLPAISATTNDNGETPLIPLQTVDKEISNDKNSSELPFYLYQVTVKKQGFETEVRNQVTIFDGQTSTLVVSMRPILKKMSIASSTTLNNERTSFLIMDVLPAISKINTPLLPRPIIPNIIAVKLGTPLSDAPVVSVDYVYYIKNVACSEIYPTWPDAALRANIYAIQSIALNRVYTEWYRQRGYPFQITSSPAFDQKFIPNREIYDSISVIVDEIYQEYIHRIGFVEPLFTTFCDGRQVTCKGLHQWETVDYANLGYSPLEILKQFYGDNIEIASSPIIQDITEGFVSDLSIGNVGPKVLLMQIYLLRISVSYPGIPQPFPLDGVYGVSFAESVKAFQKTFNLPVTGVIDDVTWYKISFVYHSVKKLAETTSEGLVSPIEYTEFTGELKSGSSGTRVLILQYLLNVIGRYVANIPWIKMDAKFGPATKRNVEAFQRHVGLPATGVVDRRTWTTLIEYYYELSQPFPQSFQVMLYPGRHLSLGDEGLAVKTIQQYLNAIGVSYLTIPVIETNGVFEKKMEDQVKAFQAEFNLPQTGVIDELTWNLIVSIYRAVIPIVLYGGYELRYDDTDYRVAVLQDYLNTIAKAYPNIPTDIVDQWFGPKTLASVIAFQKQFGLEPNGVVDEATWNKILEVFAELSQSPTT